MIIKWVGIGMLGGAAVLGIARPKRAQQRLPIAMPVIPTTPTTAPHPDAPNRSTCRESTLLDQARKELSQGNSVRAMDTLERYAREFPHGALAPAALLLRVDLLRARGDDTRAMALAKRFVADAPNGPYTASMRKWMGEARPR